MVVVCIDPACSSKFAIERIFFRPSSIKDTWFRFTLMVVVVGDKEQAPTTDPYFGGFTIGSSLPHYTALLHIYIPIVYHCITVSISISEISQ